MTTEQKKRIKDWESKFPCFTCSADGHSKASCTNPNITTCTIGKCKKIHNAKAHSNMTAYLEKKDAKKKEKEKNSQM